MKTERAGRLFIWQNSIRLRHPPIGENSVNILFPLPLSNLTKHGHSTIAESLLIRMEEKGPESPRYTKAIEILGWPLIQHYYKGNITEFMGKFIIWIVLWFPGSMRPFSVLLITSLLVLESVCAYLPLSRHVMLGIQDWTTPFISIFPHLTAIIILHKKLMEGKKKTEEKWANVKGTEGEGRRKRRKQATESRILCRTGQKPSCV